MTIRLTDHGEDRAMTLDQLRQQIGARSQARTTQRATYLTQTVSPTVYYTALAANGIDVLTSRRTSGVTLVGGLWGYDQPITLGMTDWISVWDEGDVNDYVRGWEVVDT